MKTNIDRPNYKKVKTWKDIINHPIVDDVSVETNYISEGLDYWVFLKPGYCYEFPNSEAHQIHEWGVKVTLKQFNNEVYTCNCKHCKMAHI
jgi:hypothetical protein